MAMRKDSLCGVLAVVAALALSCGLTSCEKAVFDEDTPVVEKPEEQTPEGANLTIRVSGNKVNDEFVTRAMVDITTYCTRFNFVLYQDGKKIESRSQSQGDANFGEVSLTLATGTYKLLVLAHSSQNGNPSLSDPENIQFTNALGFSDTFYYYDDIVVTKDPKTHEILLKRATTRVKFVVNDEIPSNVKYFHFYYTGGSGVFNAVTGYGGTVDSRQERLVVVTDATPYTVPLYTFLQQDTGNMQLKVTAYTENPDNNNAVVVKERTFSDIPVEHHKETILEGDFFDHSSTNGFSFLAETDWEVSERMTY